MFSVSRWRGVEFEVKHFKDLKDVYILGEVDDVLQVSQLCQGLPAVCFFIVKLNYQHL